MIALGQFSTFDKIVSILVWYPNSWEKIFSGIYICGWRNSVHFMEFILADRHISELFTEFIFLRIDNFSFTWGVYFLGVFTALSINYNFEQALTHTISCDVSILDRYSRCLAWMRLISLRWLLMKRLLCLYFR
jgi:hypothetical protein